MGGGQEFLAFLRSIDKAVPAELDIHCIVDNYATHSHPKVRAWRAARPRWNMHCIPAYSSRLNQVERFFGLITDKTIHRGSFPSVKDLISKIEPTPRTGCEIELTSRAGGRA